MNIEKEIDNIIYNIAIVVDNECHMIKKSSLIMSLQIGNFKLGELCKLAEQDKLLIKADNQELPELQEMDITGMHQEEKGNIIELRIAYKLAQKVMTTPSNGTVWMKVRMKDEMV